MNPAPGSALRAAGETMVSKRSWKQKWNDCKDYFAKHEQPQVGSSSLLKKAWKLEVRLRERAAKSHSKCNICMQIDAKLFQLRGKNTEEAKETKEMLLRSHAEHEQKHLRDRSVLDSAG